MAPQLWHASPQSVAVIRQLTPVITTVSVPFARFGLIKFGGRATITKLQSGGLVVFSPVSLTDDVKSTVQSMGGQVSYLVAPDMEHHMMLGPWKKEYPAARVIAPQGLREKRAKQNDEDVNIDFEYSKETKSTMQLPSDMADEFDVEFFDGHVNKEIVLCHKPSKALIQADLLFNMPSYEQYSKTDDVPTTGIFTRIAMLFASPGVGQQRFNWYLASKDKPSFNASVRRVNSWKFDKIIPCHGEIVESNGNDLFRKIFAWHLAA